jgi:hypothetical protein
MAVVYSPTAINFRLEGVADAVDAAGPSGSLRLLAGATVVSTISLSFPCGSASGGVLTFTGTLVDPSAANTGVVDAGAIYNAAGSVIVSGLTAGIPLSGADILINNGLNSTLINSGQVVQVLSATITGS